MRVLHVMYSAAPTRGGPHSAAGSFIEAARLAGIESEVISTDVDGRIAPAWSDRVKLTWAPVFPRRGYPLSPRMLYELWRGARRFDLFHVHGLWRFQGLAAALVSAARGTPLVVRTCGLLSPETFGQRRRRKRLYFRLVERHVLDRARAVHFTTEAEQQACVVAVRNPVVIPPAVPAPRRIPRDRARADLREPPDAPLVVCVARLDPIKRHEVLVRALALLPGPARMVFVGPDSEGREAALRALAGELGVEDRLRFAGMADPGQVAAWLSAADVFVSASQHENFGMSIAEAAMSGLAAVVPRDLHITRELGPALAAVERTPEAFAREIHEIVRGGTREELGRRLRERALELWSPESIGRRLERMYREVCGQGSG